MDFIEYFPMSHGYSIIFVVVDKFIKYDHFIPLAHPFTVSTVTMVFLNFVFKLYGTPKSVALDRNPILLSSFWKELFKFQGSTLNYSSAYHPQSDEQTEALNKCLEGYLRCYVGVKSKSRSQWMSLAKWWYNTSYHYATKVSLFEALYGYAPS